MIRQIAHIFLFIFICSSTLYPQVPKLRSVYFVSSNTGWAVGYFGVIVKTNNGGESWSPQESGTVESDLLSVYFIDHKTGFAVGWQWLDHDVILKTTNGGSDWERIGYINYLVLNSVQFIDQNVGWIVGDWGTVLKTTDIGESWTTQTSGTTDQLYSVHFEDHNLGWTVGGSFNDGLILHTSNGGEDWITQIITGIDVEKGEINDIQTNYSLNQNYPNPFNPRTTIKYSIPSITLRQAQSDILVTLKVFDVLGNEVATLVNEEKPSGSYEIEFSADKLPSGIYFYRLVAGSYIETMKMVLLK